MCGAWQAPGRSGFALIRQRRCRRSLPPAARRDCCRAALRLQSADGPADRPSPRHAGRRAPPPVTLFRPAQQSVPLVFASAHSGRDYPADFIAAARLDALTLRRSEDGFVDELFAAAPAHGAPLLAATFPRAFCDANREPWELDPAMFEERLPAWVNTASARVGAGLGTIARVVASGEAIYRRKLRFAEAERRVRLLLGAVPCGVARPGGGHAAAVRRLPAGGLPFHAGQLRTPRIRRPISCWATRTARPARAAVMRRAEQALAGMGYRVRRNDPYAGGYITRHYGRPREGVHALQVELGRPLYMDEARMAKLPAFDGVQRDMTTLVAALAGLGPALNAG